MTNQFRLGNNKASKLTGEQVIEIRERYKTERGLSQPMLSREYDVSANTIARILNGTTWRHLLRGEEPQVYRPPINARAAEVTDEVIKASVQKLFAKLDAESEVVAKIPSLYNDPPPTQTEDQEAGQLGLARLTKELDGPGPIKQQEVGEELDKLKGD